MTTPLPQHTIKPIPSYWLDGEFADWPWEKVEALHLVCSEDGNAPKQPTTVRLGYSDDALYVRFECKDRDIWWTMENSSGVGCGQQRNKERHCPHYSPAGDLDAVG